MARNVILLEYPNLPPGEREEWVFHCPGCGCGHMFRIKGPGPNWTWNGDESRPTVSPSIYANPPNLVRDDELGPSSHRCHSFVRDGKIEFLTDCTHALAGQTVELPDWDTA